MYGEPGRILEWPEDLLVRGVKHGYVDRARAVATFEAVLRDEEPEWPIGEDGKLRVKPGVVRSVGRSTHICPATSSTHILNPRSSSSTASYCILSSNSRPYMSGTSTGSTAS